MSDIEFTMVSVEGKGSRKYRKGSKYDPILDQYIKNIDTQPLVRINVTDKAPNYVRTQLNKRIETRGLDVSVSVVNNIVYLEKITK